MSRYNGFDIRNSVAAAICAAMCTTTFVLAFITPVNAAPVAATPTAVTAPLA